MKVGIIYLNILGRADESALPPDHYSPLADRFISTYRQFRGVRPHRLHVVHCGGIPSYEELQKFYEFQGVHSSYFGKGWDIGAHQHASLAYDFDFLICCNSTVYFWREGFIQAMIAAREKYGDGLYGPTASYENAPHIRTCCWAFDPKTFADYPALINDRLKTFRAESGDLCITRWYESIGKPRILVAPDGCYEQADWRKPDNIFRRGTQENCFVRDRHMDNWPNELPERKAQLAGYADGAPVI
jgi:hypothetical protein